MMFDFDTDGRAAAKPPVPLFPADRPLPYDQDAEQAVLGAALVGGENAFADAGEYLTAADFYSPANREIWQALQAVSETGGIDAVTVADELRRRGKLEIVGGLARLAQLMSAVPTAANIAHYCVIVRDRSIRRNLIRASEDVLERSYDLQHAVMDIVGRAERVMAEASTRHAGGTDERVGDGMAAVIAGIEKAGDRCGGAADDSLPPEQWPLKTGLRGIDNLVLELEPGDLVILAARASIGKTALMWNIVEYQAHKVPVGVIQIEMSNRQARYRLLCQRAKVSLTKLRVGKLTVREWEDLVTACAWLKTAQIYLDDNTSHLAGICGRAKQWRERHGIRVLWVDYLQLVQAAGRNNARTRDNEIGEITGRFKRLAKQLGIPIILLSQLNRHAEGVKPKLSHLRESGNIEQDADIVALLHRDRVHLQDSQPAEVQIAKNRNGMTGEAALTWVPQYCLFTDRSPIDDEAVPEI